MSPWNGPPESDAPDVLTEAHSLIRGDRLKFYGPPTANFERIAGMWTAYLDHPVTANDVCSMMILLKVARIRSGGSYHRDSAVDAAGYAALLEVLNDNDEPAKLGGCTHETGKCGCS